MQSNLYRLFFISLFTLLACISAFSQSPQINSISKLNGSVGHQITIDGANFGASKTSNIVFFGSVMANVNNASSSSLTVTVPAGLMYQPITVLNTSTGLQASSDSPFLSTFNEDTKKSFTSYSFTRTELENTNGHFLVYMQAADIDGDGKLDLAVANDYGQKVCIYQNTSATGQLNASSMKLAATYGVTPSYLAHGFRDIKFSDLDGDGKLDMVITYIDKDAIAVYRNNSSVGVINTASFLPKVEFSVGLGPMTVAFADLNADGKPEIITANNSLKTISVLRNKSTAGTISSTSFAAVQNFATKGDGYSVTAADMDNDKQIDLVVGEKGSIEVFLNKTGTSNTFSFDKQTIYSNGTESNRIAVGDLDNDGKKDIVSGFGYSNRIAVLRNNSLAQGSLTFEQSKLIELGGIIYTEIQLSDINGDTKPDIVFGSPGVIPNTSTNSLSFGEALWLPNGIFGPDMSDDFAVGDFDNDGKIDVMGNDGYGTISVIKNNIVGLPIVNSFTPTSVTRGANVTLKGKYLDKVTAISFGGVPAASFRANSTTELLATIGEGLSGTITYVTNDGVDSISGFTFIPPPQPAITLFEPATATVNETVAITGTNFSEVNAVSFGNTPAKSFKIISSTRIEAVLGAGASGNIKLSTKFGSGTKEGFTYVLKPIISAFSPKTAKRGEVVTITGINFIDVTGITIGGIPIATYQVVSSSEIKVTIGYGASGVITVNTAYGSFTTSYSSPGYEFSYIAGVPIIDSFSPMRAPAGATITIKGDNFHPDSSRSFVYFGASRAKVLKSSGTEITAIVPFGATYEPILVYNNAKYGYSILPFTSTHDGAPISKSSFGNKIELGGYKAFLQDANFDSKPDVFIGMSEGSYSTSALRARVNRSSPGSFAFDWAEAYNRDNMMNIDQVLLTYKGPYTQVLVTGKLYNSLTPKSLYSVSDVYFSGSGYYSQLIGSLNYNYTVAPVSVDFVNTDLNKDGLLNIVSDERFKNIRLADLNVDGFPDVLVRNEESNSLSIYKNISGSQLDNAVAFKMVGEWKLVGVPTSISTGDFDNDDKIDFAVSVKQATGTGYVSFFRNVSVGDSIIYEKKLDINGIVNPLQSKVGDLNGDGKIDYVVNFKTDSTLIYTNNSTKGNFAFAESARIGLNSANGLEVCDMDMDGRPDLVGSGVISGSATITILRNLKNDPRLDSFNPKSARKGGVITIVGRSFTGVTSVKFGGVSATSFQVISPDSIRAVVAEGSSGNVEVANATGIGNIAGFNYVTKPVVQKSANVAKAGEYISLSITPWPGVIYKWYRDGILINNAISSYLAAYNSGVYTVSVEIDNMVFTSDPVEICVGCILKPDAFTISTKGISCLGMKNGSYKIKAKNPEFEYKIIIPGMESYNTPFKDSLLVNNLYPGTHNICIALKDLPTSYQCFTIKIDEPKELQVGTMQNEKDGTVTLNLTGAGHYLIQLNDEIYTTQNSSITLKLSEGANNLSVNSDKGCQGEYKKVLYGSSYSLFPMPFSSELTIALPHAEQTELNITISDVAGKIVFRKVVIPIAGSIHLDLSSLIAGNYLLKIDGSVNTFKIVKK